MPPRWPLQSTQTARGLLKEGADIRGERPTQGTMNTAAAAATEARASDRCSSLQLSEAERVSEGHRNAQSEAVAARDNLDFLPGLQLLTA